MSGEVYITMDKTKDFEKNLEMDKVRALENAMRQIEKDFGKGAIMKLGEAAAKMNIEVIPTGSLPLDIALGVGGVPRGRVIEIFGPESSGKTTVALHIIAQAQKTDGIAAFIDAEHALDPSYAKKLGVDIDNLLISQPDNGEQALEITEALVRSAAIDVVVIDSVAALVPKNEIDGDMGDSHVGLHARLMSQALRKLTGVISKSRTTVIFINQIREKVGVMFGNPETTTGGRALKFYASIRLDVRKAETLKQGNDVVGSRAVEYVTKRGYLNDAALCDMLIERLAESNKYSLKETCLRLRRRGLPIDLINEKLRDWDSNLEYQAAIKMAMKFSHNNENQDVHKLIRRLSAKGFKASTVSKVLEHLRDMAP
ncbi:MAG: recA 2 [Firmicutes bacterium]|nr:recA 2 [Bacillota bacterium]